MQIQFHPFPQILGFSFANVCVAHCIWCPIGRNIHRRRNNRFISQEVVEKVIGDCKNRGIEEVWVSENGESLLHPKFKDVFLMIRYAFPTAPFGFATNLLLLTDDLIDFLLKYGISWFGCNIDGSTKAGYESVKGISHEKVMDNLIKLLDKRNEVKSPMGIHVSVLTQSNYYHVINESEKITLRDETLDTMYMLRNMLDINDKDSILYPFPLTWAERERWKRPRPRNVCAGLFLIGTKAFIDTDGNSYPCCMDYNSDYVFGNVLQESMENIWMGEKRKLFIQHLLNFEFDKIGKPCEYCQD